MPSPPHTKARRKLEREIGQTLEKILGDNVLVKQVTPKMPEGICGTTNTVFEVYDLKKKLLAKASLGHITANAEKPVFEKYASQLSMVCYDCTVVDSFEKFEKTIGNVDEKIEAYAKEWIALVRKVNEARNGTILMTWIKDVDFLQPLANSLEKSGTEAVFEFYNDLKLAQKEPALKKAIVQNLKISEAKVDALYKKINSELPEKYLQLRDALDNF